MSENAVKQYGIYPGVLKEEGIEKVKNGSELELYFIINGFGGFIWRMNHDSAHGRIEITKEMRENLVEAQYAMEFAVLNSVRFGVEIPEPKENEHVERTASYNKWFRWWNDYIEYKLSNEEYKELERLMEHKEDYSRFRPKGDWKIS